MRWFVLNFHTQTDKPRIGRIAHSAREASSRSYLDCSVALQIPGCVNKTVRAITRVLGWGGLFAVLLVHGESIVVAQTNSQKSESKIEPQVAQLSESDRTAEGDDATLVPNDVFVDASYLVADSRGQVFAESPATEDSYWEVSTRHLPQCPPSNCLRSLSVRRCEGSWQSSSMNELVAHCVAANYSRIVIYVHGNWMPHSDARDRARTVYNTVTCKSDAPICYIAFSWPSERQNGFAKDVIGKKERIDAESFYFANMLDAMPKDTPVGILGYSFGGRVVCGGLHLLGGGKLAHRALCKTDNTIPYVRVSLSACAFDRSALTQSGRYSCALSTIEQLVNLYNSNDPILRRFRFFDPGVSPIAAGFSGLLVPRFGASGSTASLSPNPKIRQFDCRKVGRTHSELSYFKCSAIHNAINNVLGR